MKATENIFFYGGQDKDSMHESVAEGDFLDAQNIRTLGSEESDGGKVTKVKGVTEVDNDYSDIFVGDVVSGNIAIRLSSKTYGSTRNEHNQTIYYFVLESFNVGEDVNQYAVYELDCVESKISCVLKTTSKLFELDHISADELDGVLYWAAGVEMKSIDIDKGKNWFLNYIGETSTGEAYSTINSDTFNLINRPVAVVPKIRYFGDESLKTNNLRGKLFRFRFQYIYNDNSVSVLSPYSKALLPLNETLEDGSFNLAYINNGIEIDSPSNIPSEVKAIKIYESHTIETVGTWSEFSRVKEIYDFSEFPIKYYGGIAGSVIASTDDVKLYDSIMRNPKACSIVTNPDRLLIGNGEELRDNIEVDATLEQIQVDIKTEFNIGVKNYVSPYLAKVANVLHTGILNAKRKIVWETYYNGAGVCSVVDFNDVDIDSIVEAGSFSFNISYSTGTTTSATETITIDTTGITTTIDLINAAKTQINSVYGEYAYSSIDEFVGYIMCSYISEITVDRDSDDSLIGDSFYSLNGTESSNMKRYHWLPSDAIRQDYDGNNGVLFLRAGALLGDNNAAYEFQDIRVRYNEDTTHDQQTIETYIESNLAFISNWINDNARIVVTDWENSFLAGDYTIDDGYTVSVLDGITGSLLTSTSISQTNGILSMMPFSRTGVSIIYYDEYLRNGYAQLVGDIDIDPTDNGTTFDHVSYQIGVTINHSAPSWAKYWSFAVTSNKKFIPVLNVPMAYVDEDSEYIPPWQCMTVDEDSGRLKIDITKSTQAWRKWYGNYQLSDYIFQDGDHCVLYNSAEGYIDREVVSQDDDGAIYLDYTGNTTTLADEVFIYRPTLEYVEDIYYEVGGLNKVVGSVHHKDGASIQNILTSIDYGDSYVTTTNYLLKKFEYPYGSDGNEYYDTNVFNAFYSFFYSSTVNSVGRTQSSDRNSEEKRYKGRFRWSNAYVSDTNINGIPTFDFEDMEDLSSKYGGITELYEIGHTLKVMMPSKLISVYLGISSTINPNGTQALILTDSPIGTVAVPNTDYGCQHPNSIQKVNRHLFFVDAANGVICMDSANGQQIISDKKMSNIFDAILSDVVKNGYEIKSCYDRDNSEYGVSILDGDNFTYIFSDKDGRWKGKRTYGNIDTFEFSGQNMVSFYNGDVFIHGNGEYGVFSDGESNDSWIKFLVNDNPNIVKTLKAISEHADGLWNAEEDGDIRILPNATYGNGMSSRLKSGKFKDKEGTFYSEFMRDGNTSGMDYDEGIINGRSLKYRTAIVTLRNNSSDSDSLFSVSIKYTKSNNTY